MNIQFPNTYAVYDLETTGFDPKECQIIEIGLRMVFQGTVTQTRSWLIKCPIPLPENIVELTGITDELLAEKGVDIKQAIDEFVSMVKDIPLVGHNILRFDNNFLKKHIDSMDWERMEGNFIDTAGLYKAKLLGENQMFNETHQEFALRILNMRNPGIKYNLALAYQALGGDASNIKAHRTDGDTEMTDFVYRKLTQ